MKVARPRRRFTYVALLILAAAVIGLVCLVAIVGKPIGADMAEAEAALWSDDRVIFSREPWISFEPAVGTINSGVVIYPGGRVAPEAYAPLARSLAESGSLAIIIPMPLNLAVLDAGAATAAIEAHPQIDTWVIAGHSLGGTMAARYAYENPDRADGLVILAAYPEAHINFRGRDLAVATVYGDQDGLVAVSEVERSFAQLPTDAIKILVKGGNHAQFGWYGEQAGDLPAQIGRYEQQSQVVEAVLRILDEAGKSI